MTVTFSTGLSPPLPSLPGVTVGAGDRVSGSLGGRYTTGPTGTNGDAVPAVAARPPVAVAGEELFVLIAPAIPTGATRAAGAAGSAPTDTTGGVSGSDAHRTTTGAATSAVIAATANAPSTAAGVPAPRITHPTAGPTRPPGARSAGRRAARSPGTADGVNHGQARCDYPCPTSPARTTDADTGGATGATRAAHDGSRSPCWLRHRPHRHRRRCRSRRSHQCRRRRYSWRRPM